MEKEKLLNLVTPVLKQPRWIIDGNLGEYISRGEIMNRSDLVIILNPSYLTLIYRLITRGITRNTSITIGNHTKDKADIIGNFTLKDMLIEIVESFRTITTFKKLYLAFLLDLAKKASNSNKICLIDYLRTIPKRR